MANNLIKNLKRLCMCAGVSGYEQKCGITDCLFEMIKAMNPNTKVDLAGNIISVIENPGKTIILEAHMDEIGFLIGKKNGRVILTPQGITREDKIVENDVFVVGKGIEGKVQISPANDLIFTPGDEKEMDDIEVGDLVAFKRSFVVRGDQVEACALDNRIGCSVLIEILAAAMERGSKNHLVFVFSRMEEIDESSFEEVVNNYKEAFAIVVDAAYAQPIELATSDPDFSIPILGEGCAIQTKGRDFIVLEAEAIAVKKIAAENGIRIQEERAPRDFGRTNLAKLQKQGNYRGVVINVPVRDQHQKLATTNLCDANAAVGLILELVKERSVLLQ